jgi:hypothetical protein
MTYTVCVLTHFVEFSKGKNFAMFRFLATTLLPLKLTFFNSMSTLFAIKFSLLLHTSPFLMTFQIMKMKVFQVFIIFMDFEINFLA